MAKLERVIVCGIAIGACVVAWLQSRQTTQLREEVQSFQLQQRQLEEQIRQLQSERDQSAAQSSLRCDTSNQPDRNLNEILRLRGEITVLRRQLSESLHHEMRAETDLSPFNRTQELGSGPALSVSYDSTLWSRISSTSSDSGAPQSTTWEFDAAGTGWAQITVASHPDKIDEAAYRQQLLDRQNLRGDPAELIGEGRQTVNGLDWLILEFLNRNTKPPRTELQYFMPAGDGYVTAFVVGDELQMPSYREHIETFIRQIRVR